MSDTKEFTYYGVTCRRTNTKVIPSRGRSTPLPAYELSGAMNKAAGERPFLTSAEGCRTFIRRNREFPNFHLSRP